MAYAVIELLTLNLVLNPPLRQTDVQATPPVKSFKTKLVLIIFIRYTYLIHNKNK